MKMVNAFCSMAFHVLLLLALPAFISYSSALSTRKFDRIEEVKKVCEPVVNSAAELKLHLNSGYALKRDLSFAGGEWKQEAGTHPLLPFVDGVFTSEPYPSPDVPVQGPPSKLSGFKITDIDLDSQSRKMVHVNGILNLVITRNGPVPDLGEARSQWESVEPDPQFQMRNGHSEACVIFQGVYTESTKNDGERVLCLLGHAMLPLHGSDSANPWGHVETAGPGNYQPPLSHDGNVLLVLRYPANFTLTQRAIQGEMRSLNSETDPRFFDKLHISSQLGAAEYNFGSKVVEKAFDSFPYLDGLSDFGIDCYNGYDFCSIFDKIAGVGTLRAQPNRRCNGTESFCSRVGPFATDEDVEFLVQDVHCERKNVKGNQTVTRVSLILRAVHIEGDYFIQSRRNSVGDMTLAAEGMWNAYEGRLCMVGCLGIVDIEGNACDSRVCFVIPTTFSINQRSALVGTISSINARTPTYFPLSFQFPLRDDWMCQLYSCGKLHYKYSKIDLAMSLRGKHGTTSIGNVIRNSFLKFPRWRKTDDYKSSLLHLVKDLRFYAPLASVFGPSPGRKFSTYVHMEIFSVNSIFGMSCFARNSPITQVVNHLEKAEDAMKQLTINVSAHISLTRKVAGISFSSLFLEGLYDPLVGKMYMIGCREIRVPWKVLSKIRSHDDGSDCSIEVIVSYPPSTARWLLNPTIHIFITSQRLEEDPLYFKPISLRTSAIMHRGQSEDSIFSKRGIEDFRRVLTLPLAIACIWGQLFHHIRNEADSAPYTSLVMIGIQALGYGLPLVTYMEPLFKSKQSYAFVKLHSELDGSQLFLAIHFTVNFLVLIAFLLTLRLFKKVLKSRVRLLAQASHEPHHVPNDKLVFVLTLIIHASGFIFFLSFNPSMSIRVPVYGESTARKWMSHLEEYMGFVQDLFLLPQVAGNLLWQVNCKPLRKLFYIGITVIRLFHKIYDHSFADPDLDLYSKISEIFLPLISILLAVIIYMQQRFSFHKLSRMLVFGGSKLLSFKQKTYLKLA